jgi:hypothetical protein
MDGVKRFLEVQFEDNGWIFPKVAAAKEVGRVDNVFRDTSPREETDLVGVHQRVDSSLEASSEHFGNSFHNVVLQGDCTEEGGVIGGIRFWEENKKRSVDPSEVNVSRKKGVEDRKNVISEEVPKGREESQTKAVRTRAGELVHIAEGFADLVPGERSTKTVLEQGGVWVQVG